MTELGKVSSVFRRMLWPEHTPVSDLERRQAIAWISRGHADGSITTDQAERRQALVPAARTRADLRTALEGLPGAVAPAGLLAASRIAAVLWLILGIVQLIVWAMICLISGEWDGPWWLWTVAGGTLMVGGLWWTTEWEHRMRISGAQQDPGAP